MGALFLNGGGQKMRKIGLSCWSIGLRVVVGILLSWVPIGVGISSEKDACGLATAPDEVVVASVKPCATKPNPIRVNDQKCTPWLIASCQDIPCRCFSGCIRIGRVTFCGTICEEFVSNRVRYPRCRPAPGSVCDYEPRPCGTFTKYAGNL